MSQQYAPLDHPQQPQYAQQQGYPQQQQQQYPYQQPQYAQQQQYPPQQGYQQQQGYPQQHAYPADVHNIPEYKRIMNEGLFGCLDDVSSCMMAWCLPLCVMGSNIQETNQGSFIYGCCCFPFCFAIQRSSIQQALGVADAGCLMNWLTYVFCGCCALSQETRAVKSWIASGKPSPFPSQPTMSM